MDAPAPPAYLLHDLLRRAAARLPGVEAVRCAGRSLSYGELDAASDAVAAALIDAGVRRGDRVALFAPKSVETVASLYGVMKAGAAYVPIDPKSPVARAALVAGDCAVAALVSTAERAGELVAALSHRPSLAVLLDADGAGGALDAVRTRAYAEVVAASPDGAPNVAATEDDLAYILYTSGSTGVPKGVMLTHRNALTFVEWCAREIGATSEDRLSNHAPLHFDLSVFDLYLAAFAGATVVLVPEEEAYLGASLRVFIEREAISIWYSVPSALMLLTRALAASPGGSLASLRTVVFAGEVYPTKQLRELAGWLPGVPLWNLYGPTETNVITYHRVEDLPEDDRAIPIGRACSNTDVFAVTPDGLLAGVGEEGELYARGPSVMKGYWNRPDRTAEVLVPNPISPGLPGIVYRTGDLVVPRADGAFDFRGRRDHQIKSRGYRIELGEVEAALNAHPLVREAVAVAVPHEDWGTAIVAWVAPTEDGGDLTERAVKRHVASRLPRYMVPARVDLIGALPRTSNGKLDRRRVLEESSRGAPGAA